MYILKNAWISITRNKGRNILIGIIILIIAAAATVTLAIKNTAGDLIQSYQDAYEKEVTIGFNRENMMRDFDPSQAGSREEKRAAFENIASYTIDDVEKFAESEYVTDYRYTYSVGLNGNNIEKAELSAENAEGGAPEGGGPKGFGAGDRGFGGASNTNFTLMGYNSLAAMNEFITGTYTASEMVDGAWDQALDGNNVFINEELATYNNLSLNSKIILEDTDGKTYEFMVVGIFKENETEGEGAPTMSMFSGSANTIVTNAAAVAKVTAANANLAGTVTPTFVIRSYDDVDELQAEFYAKGLDENFVLQTNEEEATSAVSSVQNTDTFATTFLIVTLVIGGVVLFVINMINIRERKYEIGVLRTIGMSKSKLTAQFVAELSIVAVIALGLGAGVGAMSARGVSNALLANEISGSNARMEEVGRNFGGGVGNGAPGDENAPGEPPSDSGGTQSGAPDFKGDMRGRGVPVVQAYETIDAVVDVKVLAELLGIGLGLVLVSSIAAMVSIQRFSPLTILKERS